MFTKDWAFEPHGQQVADEPGKAWALLALAAYVIALLAVDAIERGFQP